MLAPLGVSVDRSFWSVLKAVWTAADGAGKPGGAFMPGCHEPGEDGVTGVVGVEVDVAVVEFVALDADWIAV